jgi:hypothetical protein
VVCRLRGGVGGTCFWCRVGGGAAWSCLFGFPGLTTVGVLASLSGFGRLRSRSHDERQRSVLRAGRAFAGQVLALVIVGGWLWGLAHGRPNPTLTILGFVGGLAFLAGLVRATRRTT